MTEEEVALLREKKRLAIKEMREKMSNEEKKKEKINAKLRMRKHREKNETDGGKNKDKTDEEKDYDKIAARFKKQDHRKKRTEDEQLAEKLRAKEGMQEFREYGRLVNFSKRSKRNINEFSAWKNFYKKWKECSEIPFEKKTDLIGRLNQEIREEKEKERQKKEKEEKKREEGMWDYNGESGEWYWTGQNEPKDVDTFAFEPLTEEDRKKMKEADELHYKWWVEMRATERKEKRREQYRKYKEQMAIPLDPLPVTELCAYEKLRESNIKEREEAMRQCGFFEDLEKAKNDIVDKS